MTAMDNNIYRFIPCETRIASAEEQRDVNEIIKEVKILDHIPNAPEIVVQIEQRVSAGLSLAAAHAEWIENYFPNISTPADLPRQPLDAKTPSELLRFSISAIDRRTPGMGSHFGFKGYFLSVLISLNDRKIWDARGQSAS
jgi:hypothetical protein